MPHPLEHNFLIKVQTVPGTSPGKALKDATSELIAEVNALKSKFEMEVIRHRTFEDQKNPQSGYDGDSMNNMDHHAAMDVDF